MHYDVVNLGAEVFVDGEVSIVDGVSTLILEHRLHEEARDILAPQLLEGQLDLDHLINLCVVLVKAELKLVVNNLSKDVSVRRDAALALKSSFTHGAV